MSGVAVEFGIITIITQIKVKGIHQLLRRFLKKIEQGKLILNTLLILNISMKRKTVANFYYYQWYSSNASVTKTILKVECSINLLWCVNTRAIRLSGFERNIFLFYFLVRYTYSNVFLSVISPIKIRLLHAFRISVRFSNPKSWNFVMATRQVCTSAISWWGRIYLFAKWEFFLQHGWNYPIRWRNNKILKNSFLIIK